MTREQKTLLQESAREHWSNLCAKRDTLMAKHQANPNHIDASHHKLEINRLIAKIDSLGKVMSWLGEQVVE